MAIDPAELEGLDEEGVRALYEDRLQQQQSTASREVSLLWCGHCSGHPAPCRSRSSWLQGAPRAVHRLARSDSTLRCLTCAELHSRISWLHEALLAAVAPPVCLGVLALYPAAPCHAPSSP